MPVTHQLVAVRVAQWHPVVPCRASPGLSRIVVTAHSRANPFAIQAVVLATAVTVARAVTEEVATQRRIATRCFRLEIRRECLLTGASTAIACLVSVETVMGADTAAGVMASTGATTA